MSRKRRSKQRAERIHRTRRAMERYGQAFGTKTFEKWVGMIQSGNHTVVRKMWKSSNTRTVFAILHEDQWIPVAYNKSTKQIVTVLPADALNGTELAEATT